MRFIIYGAGGIGGTIGARLAQNGFDVVLIARGAHLKVLRENGLTFMTPTESMVLKIPAVGYPSEIEWQEDDVVIMSMKTQHSQDALETLRTHAGTDIPVICCQNGVANERMASRIFNRVYGMVVMLPASHMEPGIVRAESKARTGILDAGCYPTGTDEVIEEVCAALSASNCSSFADEKVMRYKYAKLLMNLGNSLQALVEPGSDGAGDIHRLMMKEALACYKAAGIDCASQEEFTKRRADHIQVAPIEGTNRGGGSSWQSIARGTGDIESDYLNGEISLLGRLHGVPTPANTTLQNLAIKLARDKGPVGSYRAAELKELIMAAGGEF